MLTLFKDLPERWPAKLEKKVKEELKRHGHGDDILKQPPVSKRKFLTPCPGFRSGGEDI